MLALAVSVVLGYQTPLARDSYGVPIVRAATTEEAMMWAGYATAQDRMWQMEMSRRSAQSRLSEVLGDGSINADKQQFQQFYTQAELTQQFKRMPKNIQGWFKSYAKGVNKFIAEGNLPPEYRANGFEPQQWTEIDSVAITVQLLQLFGRGGAGELRNLALLKYLEGQSKLKGKELTVFDDFLWQNDSNAVPTVLPGDDTTKPVAFPNPDIRGTLDHLKQLPDLGVFELLPGVRVVANDESKRVAQTNATPFKSGSYCVAVNSKRSESGNAMLLSGPQMGFTVPSICHEISIHSKDLDVAGMAVPGVPGVMIGATENIAWGLTTGVADTEDIYLLNLIEGGYKVDGKNKKLTSTILEIPVKGARPARVVRKDTEFGPIVFEVPAKLVGFARKRIYQGRELQSYEAVTGLWKAKTVSDFTKSVARATMNFNCFVALKNGDIAWRYLGEVPLRSLEFDPRFPLPATKKAMWKGRIPFNQMPGVVNPGQGYIANWNNKPAAWWPNLDSPVWGEHFRNQVLTSFLDTVRTPGIHNKPIGIDMLRMVPPVLAQTNSAWQAYAPWLKSKPEFANYAGEMLAGSKQSLLLQKFIGEIRTLVFTTTTGNFAGNLELVGQPDVVVKALKGQTKFDYLQGRSAEFLITTALERAQANLDPAGFVPGMLPVPASSGLSRPMYRDRGTYLQIIELGKETKGMNVVTPGVATSGNHAADQVELARNFDYKPMTIK